MLMTVFLSLVVTLLIDTLKRETCFSMILANIVGSGLLQDFFRSHLSSLRVTCEELKTIWACIKPFCFTLF